MCAWIQQGNVPGETGKAVVEAEQGRDETKPGQKARQKPPRGWLQPIAASGVLRCRIFPSQAKGCWFPTCQSWVKDDLPPPHLTWSGEMRKFLTTSPDLSSTNELFVLEHQSQGLQENHSTGSAGSWAENHDMVPLWEMKVILGKKDPGAESSPGKPRSLLPKD